MPFITKDARAKYPTGDEYNLMRAAEGPVGDRCFVFYRPMIHAWKKARRWTTAHEIFRRMSDTLPYLGPDDRAAFQLAWQVFFALHVLPYEIEKRNENGEVE